MLDAEGLRFRSALFQTVRRFFRNQGFLEVDTPIRQPVLIPESTIEPLGSASWFLQTSPEQCMKRLLARGCDKIFQICPCFRAGERGPRHLEEFTMLEWYRLGSDYRDLMEDCQLLICFIVESLRADPRFVAAIDGSWFGSIDLTEQWERLTVAEAFQRWTATSPDEALQSGRFDEIVSFDIEPRLGLTAPAILYDYPAACGSLARLSDKDAAVAERFELYINSMELANGFSELTDPNEQRLRFGLELDKIEQSGRRRPPMPERFLEDLEHIDTAAGIAFGLDRLLMLLLSAASINEVVSVSPDDWGVQG
jgi:lysyl-tRNA synthetase class 2